jgi:excisionase family DNA binding protein
MTSRNSTMAFPPVYTVSEFAAITKWKVSTVRKKLHERKIAYIKLGRNVRIPESELERLLKEGHRPALTNNGRKE